MNKIYDVVIIGAGPAGLNAALYASRSNLTTALVEKGAPGGKMTQTSKIENWLGFDLIEGYELSMKAYDHAKSFGVEHIFGEVVKIDKVKDKEFHTLLSDNTTLISKTVIIATGMVNREPSFIENYEMFKFRGISFCATCDGPLFKDKVVVALGGGNSAVEESAFLAKLAKKVYLVVKDDHFIAEARLVEDLKKIPNVEIHMSTVIKSINGQNGIEEFTLVNAKGEEIKIQAQGFFPFIGFIPSNDSFKHLNITDKAGFIMTDENMETDVKDLYAVGDIRQKTVRQIVTAAADGAIAAKNIADKLSI